MKNVFAAVAVGLTAAVATATPLAPGQTTFPASPEIDGPFGNLVGFLVSNFNDVNTFYTGTVTSAVYTNDPTNPFGPTGLTFTYVIHNDATSVNNLGRFTALGWDSLPTDVSFNPALPVGGAMPFQQDRDAGGQVIGWSFANIGAAGFISSVIAPGQDSAMLVVQVPATSINHSTGNVIDGSISTMEILAPIPTPGASALVAMGLLASARRRSR